MAGNQTITVKEADGVTLTDVEVLGTGRQAVAASKSVGWANEDQAAIGIVTETAPAGDTASSGLNGRLQRIAQRISSLIGLFPNALGASGGLKVEIVAGAGSGGTATADKGAFVAGTTSGTPAMGFYQTTVTANPLTTGQAGWAQMTPFRANHINLRDSAGNELVLPAALGGSGGLKVEVIGGSSGGTSSNVGSAAPAVATAIGFSDGTNMVLGRIKAASTAPVATDPAIVVAISPNSINANGQTTKSASAPVTLASDQSTLAVAFDTTQIANGVSGTMVTPAKVKISVASATTTTLVALVASKKIRIFSMYLVSTAANTVTFQSHTTTSNSDGGCAYAANGGISLPFNPIGWFDSTAGEALDMVTSGAGQVSGQLTYGAV